MKTNQTQFLAIPTEVLNRIDAYCNKYKLSLTKRNSMVITYMSILSYSDNKGYTFKLRQRLIGKKSKFCREYTCTLISHLSKCGVIKKIEDKSVELDMFKQVYKYFLPFQSALRNAWELMRKFKENKGKHKSNKVVKDGHKQVKGYKNSSKVDTFNDYPQREYSQDELSDLEKRLLGWET